jgi:hypothetical protein
VTSSGGGGLSSLALGLGAFPPANAPRGAARTAACFALLHPGKGAPTTTVLQFHPPGFEVEATPPALGERCGGFVARSVGEPPDGSGDGCELRCTPAGGLRATFTAGNVTVTFNASSLSPGPFFSSDGALARALRPLPLHWLIGSLAAQPVDFSVSGLSSRPGGGGGGGLGGGGGAVGSGRAHLEKNWGAAFPAWWVWAQAARGGGADGADGAAVAVAGGSPPPLPWAPAWVSEALPVAWLPRLRVFSLFLRISCGFSLSIDASNPALARVDAEPCGGALSLRLESWGHVVELRATAPPASFSPLTCPTSSGFRDASVESFAAALSVHVWEKRGWRLPFSGGGRRELVAREAFTGAALEFGGDARCGGGGVAAAA